ETTKQWSRRESNPDPGPCASALRPRRNHPGPNKQKAGEGHSPPPRPFTHKEVPDRPPSQTPPNTVNGNRQQKRSPKLWSNTQTPANLHPKPKLTPFGLPNRKIRKPGLTGRRTGDHTPPS